MVEVFAGLVVFAAGVVVFVTGLVVFELVVVFGLGAVELAVVLLGRVEFEAVELLISPLTGPAGVAVVILL